MSKQDGLLPTPPASLQISGGVSLSERLKQIQKLKEQTSKNQANNEEDENDQQEEEEEQETNFYGRVNQNQFQKQQDDDDDQEEEEDEQEQQQAKPRSLGGQSYGFGMQKLTPQQQKLAELRKRVSTIRSENHKLVLAEDKRNSQPSANEKKRAREEYEQEQEKHQQELTEQGIDPETDKLMSLPAAVAEQRTKKFKKQQSEKSNATVNERGPTDPAVHHRFYKKQVKSTLANDPSTLEDYEKQKQSMPESEFYPTADNLNYGKSAPISDEKKDKLVADLSARFEKRKQFHRRRQHFAEATVDYINDGNAKFNAKINKAFDKYTAEIKNNLERGTAI